MKINIITTATIRPKILEKTYKSFTNNIKELKDSKLIINIDLIGETINKKIINETIRIVNKYFPKNKINISEKPSFSNAVKWCWNNIDDDCEYVFILEDDWTINKKINLNHMIEIHKKNPYLASLKLSKINLKKSKKSILNGFIHEDKLSFNPNLIKSEFIKQCAPLISETGNPEKQMRNNNPLMKDIINKWKYGIYIGSGYDKIVNDIGRSWMNNSKFKKQTGFLKWEEK